jgi:hypothetical protein
MKTRIFSAFEVLTFRLQRCKNWLEGTMKKTTIWICMLLFAFLTFNTSCSTAEEEETFSILGNWNITMTYSGTWTYHGTITFAGSNTSGSTTVTVSPDWTSGTSTGNGTYTVMGSTVTWSVYWPSAGYTDDCTGTITTDNTMNGTLVETPGDSPGIWTCTR